jgi:dihydrofolate reductase
MSISIIVAMSQNRVIGKDNHLPWHLPEDLKHFKKITTDHPIIMGRKTSESIGRKLPDRINCVVTRRTDFTTNCEEVFNSFDEVLAYANSSNEECFIIGGEEIYRLALPHADKIYMTVIEKNFEGDAFFPEVDLENDFVVIKKAETQISEKEKLPFHFVIAKRT